MISYDVTNSAPAFFQIFPLKLCGHYDHLLSAHFLFSFCHSVTINWIIFKPLNTTIAYLQKLLQIIPDQCAILVHQPIFSLR